MHYETNIQTDDFISIMFFGRRHDGQQPSPTNIFRAFNADVQELKILQLSDIVDLVSLVDMLARVERGFEQRNGYIFFLEENMNHRIIELAPWYLTSDSLGLSVELPTVIGGFARFEIPFVEIKDYLTDDFRSRMRI